MAAQIRKIQRKYADFEVFWTGPDENEQSFNDLIKSLKFREKQIISFLEKDPECSWNINKEGFEVSGLNLTGNNPDPNSTCGENYQTIKDLIIGAR